jgi:hypothetical protein
VLWGVVTDVCSVLQFEQGSSNLETSLENDGHFLVECIHDCGHAEPPFEPPANATKFSALWEFVEAHPFWTSEGASPYSKSLPETLPSRCGVQRRQRIAAHGGPQRMSTVTLSAAPLSRARASHMRTGSPFANAVIASTMRWPSTSNRSL